MRGQPNERNLDRYCDFHQEVGHHTAGCCQLKTKLQGLADRGMLNDFVKKPQERVHRVCVASTERGVTELPLPPMSSTKRRRSNEHDLPSSPFQERWT
ncbi:unnamed protein product [Linum trigynum]|uniref:Reverse transcriptase domain-containing protein n=1 Tax=Linum trigynum TaxID=586398 RepID=A0AAV2CU55_9ROSI